MELDDGRVMGYINVGLTWYPKKAKKKKVLFSTGLRSLEPGDYFLLEHRKWLPNVSKVSENIAEIAEADREAGMERQADTDMVEGGGIGREASRSVAVSVLEDLANWG